MMEEAGVDDHSDSQSDNENKENDSNYVEIGKPGFYAVRQGKHSLKNCIFLDWTNCSEFVKDFEEAEFSAFNNVYDALGFLSDESDGSGADEDDDDAAASKANLGQSTLIEWAADSSVINALQKNNPDTVYDFFAKTTITDGDEHPSKMPAKESKEDRKRGASKLMEWAADDTVLASLAQAEYDEPPRSVKRKRGKAPKKPKKRELLRMNRPAPPPPPEDPWQRRIDKERDPWEKMYLRLRAYKEKQKTLTVQREIDEELFYWFEQQKRDIVTKNIQGRRIISPNHQGKLTWIGLNSFFLQWDEKYQALKEYVGQYGHDSMFLESAYPDLAKWVIKQKMEIEGFENKRPINISFERIQHLKAIGIDEIPLKTQPHGWEAYFVEKKEKFDKDFEEFFPKLLEYREEKGDCLVPKMYPGGLGMWVQRQRQQYLRLQEGRRSVLTAQHVIRLNDVGFVFRMTKLTRHKSFKERVEELREFKEKHGHFRVPRGEGATKTLGRWLEEMRWQYRRYKSGQYAKGMNPERVSALEAIGVDWEPLETKQKKAKEGSETQEDAKPAPIDETMDESQPKVNPNLQETNLAVAVAGLNELADGGFGPQFLGVARLPDGSPMIDPTPLTPLIPGGIEALVNSPEEDKGLFKKAKRFTWEERVQQLKDFKAEHGHLLVPKSHQLGVYLKGIRRHYRAFKVGRPSGTLTAERIQLLLDMGMDFAPEAHFRKSFVAKRSGIL